MHHVQALNPFHHYTAAMISALLNLFSQRVNSVLYFISEGELDHHFAMVTEASSGMPNSMMAELCLALTLGAQVSNGGDDDKTIIWYENGRRYLDVEDWRNAPWVMRGMALISMYHIEERKDTSRHYLG